LKIYISGPITGRKDFNREAFDKAGIIIQGLGFDPVSPFDVSPYHPGKKWIDYMLEDIPAMLKCEAVAALPGWIWSRGARIEIAIAWMLKIKIIKIKV